MASEYGLTANQSNNMPAQPSRRALVWGIAALPTLVSGCASHSERAYNEVRSILAPTWGIGLMEAQPITSGPSFQKLIGVQLRLKNLMPASTKKQADFVLFDSQERQVMALSFQRIGMTSGLLEACENDGQIAAFLCQRLACLTLASTDPVKYSYLPQALFGDVGRPQGSSEQASFETQADIVAIESLARVGYDPRDGLVLAKYSGDSAENNFLPKLRRQSLISAKLKLMGYQV